MSQSAQSPSGDCNRPGGRLETHARLGQQSQSAQSPSGDCNTQITALVFISGLLPSVAISPIPFGGLQQDLEVVAAVAAKVASRNQPNPLRGIATDRSTGSLISSPVMSLVAISPIPLGGLQLAVDNDDNLVGHSFFLDAISPIPFGGLQLADSWSSP